MAATTRHWLMRHKTVYLLNALALAVALLLALLLAHRGGPPDPFQAFPNREIVVGVDASFPPFALDDGESIAGLDIDLARSIAEALEMPMRFVNIGFYALHDALLSGQVDLLVSALRLDPARRDDLRYTQAYFDNGLVIVAAATDLERNIASLPNARIAYEYASSAEAEIRRRLEAGQSIQRLPYEQPQYALDALQLGLADAAIVDATTLRLYQSQDSDWTAAYQYISHDPYVIAIRIDRADAWQLVNSALDTLKENGELARIINRWL